MSSKKNYSKVKFVEVKVIEQNLRSEQEIGDEVESLVRLLGSKVSAELQVIIMEMMLGFSKEMQQEIADDLLDFAYENVVQTTGCWSADAVLKSCYEWIAEEQGFKLSL
jgi:hypothetical protein